MAESLNQLVDATLLQPLHIVFDLFVQREFVLVEVKVIARCNDNKFVIIEELGSSYLLRKFRVLGTGLGCHLVALL